MIEISYVDLKDNMGSNASFESITELNIFLKDNLILVYSITEYEGNDKKMDYKEMLVREVSEKIEQEMNNFIERVKENCIIRNYAYEIYIKETISEIFGDYDSMKYDFTVEELKVFLTKKDLLHYLYKEFLQLDNYDEVGDTIIGIMKGGL